MTTGLELKVRRIRRGVKQLQLSRETGISATRLSMIENGWVQPRADELERYEKALGERDGKSTDK